MLITMNLYSYFTQGYLYPSSKGYSYPCSSVVEEMKAYLSSPSAPLSRTKFESLKSLDRFAGNMLVKCYGNESASFQFPLETDVVKSKYTALMLVGRVNEDKHMKEITIQNLAKFDAFEKELEESGAYYENTALPTHLHNLKKGFEQVIKDLDLKITQEERHLDFILKRIE